MFGFGFRVKVSDRTQTLFEISGGVTVHRVEDAGCSACARVCAGVYMRVCVCVCVCVPVCMCLVFIGLGFGYNDPHANTNTNIV